MQLSIEEFPGLPVYRYWRSGLWRSVKYKEAYLKSYTSVLDAITNLNAYFSFYDHKRLSIVGLSHPGDRSFWLNQKESMN